jgi:DNA-binding NtrC family response regulator
MRVVIAEDSKIYRALMKRHFEEWGLSCVFASDGAEAWTLLRDQELPALALLDWVLPKLEGIDLCRKIRGEAMSQVQGNKRTAARLLGIGKTTLYRKLKEYNARERESK